MFYGRSTTRREALQPRFVPSEQSHGESFISLSANRFEQGIYILDEPEAALSPQRQLSFLKIIHDLATPGHAQFLIATHSPIYSQLSRCGSLQPRWGYDPGDQLP